MKFIEPEQIKINSINGQTTTNVLTILNQVPASIKKPCFKLSDLRADLAARNPDYDTQTGGWKLYKTISELTAKGVLHKHSRGYYIIDLEKLSIV